MQGARQAGGGGGVEGAAGGEEAPPGTQAAADGARPDATAARQPPLRNGGRDGDGGALAAARDELERATAAVKAAQADEERNGRAADDARKKYEPKKARVDAHKRDFDRYTAELEAKQKEAEEPKLRSQKLKLKHRKLHTAYKAADDAAKEAEKKVREAKSYIDEKTPQVQAIYGDRVVDDEGRTAAQLQAAYEKMNRQLKKQQEKHGGKSIDELRTTAETHVQKLNEKREELKIVIRTKGEREGAEGAVQVWAEVAAGVRRLQHVPQQEAARRRPPLRPDEETRQLEVSRNSQDANAKSTATRATRRAASARSPRSRSSWRCGTSARPVRVLDEFDVYMDDTYRKRAVDAVDCATRSRSASSSSSRRRTCTPSPTEGRPARCRRSDGGCVERAAFEYTTVKSCC